MNTTFAPDLTMASPSQPVRGRVWTVGLVAGLVAGAATEVFAFAAHAGGITMRAGNLGASTAADIPPGSFAMGTLVCTIWGTVLAAVLARRATRPARSFTVAATVLAVLSLIGPIGAGATGVSTKLVLCVAHLVAAGIVIPALRRRLTTQA